MCNHDNQHAQRGRTSASVFTSLNRSFCLRGCGRRIPRRRSTLYIFLGNAALQAPPKKLTEFLIFRVLIALRLPVVYNNRVIGGDGFLRGVDPSFITSVASLKEAPAHTRCLCLPGVTDYLSAEISTSKQKKFSLVTFVDTPGLVDGDMVYPFNVNSAITWLGTSLQRRV